MWLPHPHCLFFVQLSVLLLEEEGYGEVPADFHVEVEGGEARLPCHTGILRSRSSFFRVRTPLLIRLSASRPWSAVAQMIGLVALVVVRASLTAR